MDKHSRTRAGKNRCVRVTLAGCLVSMAILSGGSAQEPPRPDLSGSWELDEERSDDAVEKLRQVLRSERELAQRRGGGRSGFRGGRPGAGGAAGEDQDRQSRLEALAASVRIVTIAQQDPVLELTSGLADSDWALTVFTDGREFERASPAGESVMATAIWERGGRLVVRYEPVEGFQAKETWELVADGTRILLTTEVTGKTIQGIRYLRVYDRVEIVPWDVPE